MENTQKTTVYEDYFNVAPGVWGMRIVFANVYMIATENNEWILVDAGLGGFADRIKKMADELFGENNPPSAIILTHGHFDHVGALKKLLEMWNDIPVYAHPLEIPYLTGLSAYPPPDPTVGGGMMSTLSVLYPKKPIDLGNKVFVLSEDGSLPYLREWRYIFTPGHSPGHISLFRNRDKLLIAGDAFVTTKQESAFSVATQKRLVSGPPKYFTADWIAAAESVKKLRDLHPAIAATGHGKPMYGKELTDGLDYLVNHFKEVAVPNHGRYVKQPAKTNKRGVQYVPPEPFNPVLAVSVAGLVALGVYALLKRSKK